jgi:hypothetical protein
MAERAKLTAPTVPDLDVSGFKPRQSTPERPIEQMREASERAGLVSREPQKKPAKKADRRRRTWRHEQLNIKCTEPEKGEFLALFDTYQAKDDKITQIEVLLMAVRALKQLDSRKAGE